MPEFERDPDRVRSAQSRAIYTSPLHLPKERGVATGDAWALLDPRLASLRHRLGVTLHKACLRDRGHLSATEHGLPAYVAAKLPSMPTL